jgi:hypothetical protein
MNYKHMMAYSPKEMIELYRLLSKLCATHNLNMNEF